MKPKFILTIVALNTLFLVASIATVSSVKAEDNIAELSQTISKLVGLDGNAPNLVKSAIDRALLTKEKAINLTTGKDAPPPRPEQLGGQG
jgi:hypothetical protein